MIKLFPNSDSELKGSTRGQKIGTRITTGMVAREFISNPGDSFLLCICRDRAWCLRHSAAEWPLLKFTTVNINEKSSRLHFVQYIQRLFLENRIPSKTSIDISIDFHCFPFLSPPGPRITESTQNRFRIVPESPQICYIIVPESQNRSRRPPQMPRICFQMLHTENRKTLH